MHTLDKGQARFTLSGRLKRPEDPDRPGDTTHKIPKELYADLVEDARIVAVPDTWLERAEATLELLASRANRELAQTALAKMAALVPTPALDLHRHRLKRLRVQMGELPFGRRCAVWWELHLQELDLKHAMAVGEAQVDAQKATVLDEWRATCARLLQSQNRARATQQTLAQSLRKVAA